MDKLVSLVKYDFADLAKEQQDFLKEAVFATSKSYAPYSEFYVGCAVQLASGELVHGGNQENSSFPSGLCAERVALFQCAKNLDDKVLKIAVYAKSDKYKVPTPLVPCAGCLQVISDIRSRQKSAIEIWMYDGDQTVYMATDVDQFLPFHFTLEDK